MWTITSTSAALVGFPRWLNSFSSSKMVLFNKILDAQGSGFDYSFQMLKENYYSSVLCTNETA